MNHKYNYVTKTLLIGILLSTIQPAFAAWRSNTKDSTPPQSTTSKSTPLRTACIIATGMGGVALAIYLINRHRAAKKKFKPIVRRPPQKLQAPPQPSKLNNLLGLRPQGPVTGAIRQKIDDATRNIPSQEVIAKYFNELESVRQNNKEYHNITVCDRGDIYGNENRWFVIFFKDLETCPITIRPTDKDQDLNQQKAFVSYCIPKGEKRIVIDTLYTQPAHVASKALLIKQLIIEANKASISTIDLSVKTPDIDDFIAEINFYTQFGANFFVTPIFSGGYYICAYIKPSELLPATT